MISKTYNYFRIVMPIFSMLGMILIIKFVKDDLVQLMFISSIFTIGAIFRYWEKSRDKKQGKPSDIGEIMFWMNSIVALAIWGVVVYYSVYE